MSMKLGQIETGADLQPGRRDAFHVAAVLVKSWHDVHGGGPVRFKDDSFTEVETCPYSARHAIVDPFIVRVEAGTLFWVLLMPDLAHSLHHQFELRITDVPSAELALPAQEEDDGGWNCQGCQ